MNDEKKNTNSIEMVSCYDCDKEVEKESACYYHSHAICQSCIDDNYTTCDDCGEIEKVDYTRNVRNNIGSVCAGCYEDNYRACCDCGYVLNLASEVHHIIDLECYCQDCYNERNEDDEEEVPSNSYSSTKEFIDTKKGKKVNSLRPFGVEIECHFESTSDIRAVKGHYPTLGIEDDGSLDGRGVEFQTPQLAGKKGEDYITGLCQLLKDGDFTVEDDCGLHIHLDGLNMLKVDEEASAEIQRDQKCAAGDALKNIWLFYMAYEDVIMSFLPQSRRDNTYCNPLRLNYHAEEIESAYSLDELEKIWYRGTLEAVKIKKRNHKDESRYRGINLHTLIAFNHLEIRFHSGTINARKILEWVNLHATILDEVSTCKTHFSSRHGIKYSTLEEKTDSFFQILKLSKDSEEYFRTRQNKFKEITKEFKPKKEMVALLDDESTN